MPRKTTKLTADTLASRVRADLYSWCVLALDPAGHTPMPHHIVLIKALEELARGDNKRLIICMPPGSSKSIYASVLFPVWWMANNPRCNVIACSYASSLAEDFSRMARNYVNDNAQYLGVSIPTGSNAVKAWALDNRATYRAGGVGGAITGKRADLLIIDDAIKGIEEADSPDRKNAIERWYKNDAYTRRKNSDSKIVVIGTRWAEDDLIGRLLADESEQWKLVSLPAICVDPETDLLGRELGAPLWAEKEDLKDLQTVRNIIGERSWSALYQQNPVPQSGSLFNITKFGEPEIIRPKYNECTLVRAWDLASSDTSKTKNPDFTRGVLMARTSSTNNFQDARYIILDIVGIQGEPREVEELILDTAAEDGKGVPISCPVDPGSAGKAYADYLTRLLAGYQVETTRETGSKIIRATPFASQVNAGNVRILMGHWNRSFLDELSVFPFGLKDDQIDACSRAFNYLVEKNQRKASFGRLNWRR